MGVFDFHLLTAVFVANGYDHCTEMGSITWIQAWAGHDVMEAYVWKQHLGTSY